MGLIPDCEPRRVVITATNFITPYGEKDAAFDKMQQGITGISKAPFDHPDVHFAGHISASVYDQLLLRDGQPIIPKKELRDMSRSVVLSTLAVDGALREARLKNDDGSLLYPRTAISIGTGIGGIAEQNPDKPVHNVFVALPERVSTAPSIFEHTQGEVITTTMASAAGVISIGETARKIAHGYYDAGVAGATESILNQMIITDSFDNIRVLSRNNDPEHLSMPFDQDSDGIIFGEGAGVVVLETLNSALERGVQPIAEVIGYAQTSDGYSRADIPNRAVGLRRAMQEATSGLEELPKAATIFVYTHGSGNGNGDIKEAQAMQDFFGDDIKKVWGGANKAYTGHAMGGASGLSTAIAVESLKRGILLPNLHRNLRSEVVFNHSKDAQSMQPDLIMVNAIGLGGINASVVLKPYRE